MRAATLLTLVAATARAQAPSGAPLTTAEGTSRTATRANLTLGGYGEVFYQYNFNAPSNGITNHRGFDNRHNAFTIANAVIDAVGMIGPVSAHLALQIGHTPETYYLAEPSSRGTEMGAGTTGPPVWKFLQQANVAWHAPVGKHGLHLEAGLFLSPIGPEGMAVKDQWNWSRSNLFFGLPFYHTGVRATWQATERLALSAQLYNGWNSVVDNNAEKSIAAQVTYAIRDRFTLNLLYFTGVERSPGSVEGRPWRHLFDAYAVWYALGWLSLMAHADGGFEAGALGTNVWLAGALYARFQPHERVYLAARGDVFWERLAGSESQIFWPHRWVSSATATIHVRPAENLSLRLEYRHDHAAGEMYFRDRVVGVLDGGFLPNASYQDTLTAGATAWF